MGATGTLKSPVMSATIAPGTPKSSIRPATPKSFFTPATPKSTGMATSSSPLAASVPAIVAVMEGAATGYTSGYV